MTLLDSLIVLVLMHSFTGASDSVIDSLVQFVVTAEQNCERLVETRVPCWNCTSQLQIIALKMIGKGFYRK